MSDMQIQQVLAQMRTLAQAAQGQPAAPSQSGATEFSTLLKQSLEQVNSAQKESADLTTRFVAGDESVSLSDAVVAMQKSSLQFEAVAQVRNRLLSAYQEIMNMPV